MIDATWVWEAPTDVAEALGFLRRHGVTEVYVSVPFAGPDAAIGRFVDRARAQGIACSCLGSDPHWVHHPEHAAQWLARAEAGATFGGIHLDVEPWQLPDWTTRRTELIDGHRALLAQLRRHTELPIAIDLPAWAAEVTHRGGTYGDIVVDADAVSILSYRDRARGDRGILPFSAGMRSICGSAGVPYRIGLETLPADVVGGPELTFADDGAAVLRRESAVVTAALRRDQGFQGIAVHDLGHWRDLRP